MRHHLVHYQLEHGFINNWLVAGPQTNPLKTNQVHGENLKQIIIRSYYDSNSGITATPVERGPLTRGLFQVGDYSGSWNYYACREDHQVDRSGIYSTPHYLRSWAYTQVASKAAMDVLLVLTTPGPADLWLNGQHIHRQEYFHEQQPGFLPLKGQLAKGINKLLVRFEAIALGCCPNAMALQICKTGGSQSLSQLEPYPPDGDIHVCIPTLIQGIPRRNNFESVYTSTFIKQDIFTSEEPIYLHWPEEQNKPSPALVRLLTDTGKIYAEANVDGMAGDKLFLGYPHQVPEGPYRILMMPLAWEYYERDMRITRELNLWSLGRNKYSTVPYGTLANRRQEALIDAAGKTGLFAEYAKMALNKWKDVNPKIIMHAAQDAAIQDLLGLLGILYRFGDRAEFPKELTQPLDDFILSFKFWLEDSSVDKSAPRESQLIISHVCEILAGQRYLERTFSVSGKKGKWHRENGDRLALEWLQRRGSAGFADWDSSLSFAEILTALSHLIDLAETEQVWELASVLMDKIFFTIAINSYQGVLGSSHGRTCAPFVKGGLLEPTSGITRLMWGTGIFNHHIAGTVSLAIMEKYELPSIVSSIAVSLPEEMWNQERHAIDAERFVNKVTYKTPDTMLCSAQNYHPGETGSQEHIWQATLGPAATVFVTHPLCSSENEARQPNFWAGNVSLPRVAQWKDALCAVYHLPNDDWMGFTHAYFPIYAFDEYAIREGWAFARKGNGYIALTCARGFELIKTGYYAFRELRSYGQDNTWFCQLGRVVLDGDFTTFQDKVLAMDVKCEYQAVQCTTLRGDVLSFGWSGPFVRNGQEQPLSDFMHYENPYTRTSYPCTQMEIQFGEDLMRLDFGSSAG